MPDFEDLGCVMLGLLGVLIVIALVVCVGIVVFVAGGAALLNG